MNHPQVAQLLGLSAPTVSRMRTGVQAPTLATMRKVEEVFGWSVADQDQRQRRGTWAEVFERWVNEYAQNNAEPATA